MDLENQTDVVFKSSRTDEVDPVSGNEVPLGSTPEEVRDDIPAQLSEGEYVVPADVVKFFGVKHFEDLRTEAKMGFSQMDANGRIGGEPIGGMEMGGDELPFDISELQMTDDGQPEQPMMNQGGLISGYSEGGEVNTALESFTGSSSSVTYKTYVNAEGKTIQIPFFNGVPMAVIPEGYTLQGSTPAVTEKKSNVGGGGGGGGNFVPPPKAIDYTKLTSAELKKMVEDQKSTSRDLISGGLGMLSPIVGLVAKLAFKDMANKTQAELQRRVESPEYADEKDFYSAMLVEADEEKPKFLERVWGTITGKDDEEEVSSEPVDQEALDGVAREALRTPPETVIDPQQIIDDLEKAVYSSETVAQPGDLDLPEITTSVLPDPFVGMIGNAIDSAPTTEAEGWAAEGKKFADSYNNTGSNDTGLASDNNNSGLSLAEQTLAGARKRDKNIQDYWDEGNETGVAFITDSTGTKREVDTYKREDVLNSKIRPGGR